MLAKATEYALRSAIYVVGQSKVGRRVGVDEIAEELGAPRHFVAKILQTLTKNQILLSAKGPNGGFYWEAQTPRIMALDIILLMEGRGFLTECVLGLKTCSSKNPCPLHYQYKPSRDRILAMFGEASLEDLSLSLLQDHTHLK